MKVSAVLLRSPQNLLADLLEKGLGLKNINASKLSKYGILDCEIEDEKRLENMLGTGFFREAEVDGLRRILVTK